MWSHFFTFASTVSICQITCSVQLDTVSTVRDDLWCFAKEVPNTWQINCVIRWWVLYESFYCKTVLMLPITTLHTCNLRLIHGKKQAKIYPNFLFSEFRSRSITDEIEREPAKILIIRALHLINYLPYLT